ncbi:hypothetical protein CerSpe_080220 [Prunus speciosa]
MANGLLTADKHCIGRTVDDVRFQIESTAVSGRQCKRYYKASIGIFDRSNSKHKWDISQLEEVDKRWP